MRFTRAAADSTGRYRQAAVNALLPIDDPDNPRASDGLHHGRLPSFRRNRLIVTETVLVKGSACSSQTCSNSSSALTTPGATREARTSRIGELLRSGGRRAPLSS